MKLLDFENFDRSGGIGVSYIPKGGFLDIDTGTGKTDLILRF